MVELRLISSSGPPPTTPVINPDIVSSLEVLLAQARAGEITTMAWVAIGAVAGCKTGYGSLYGSEEPTLLGGIDLLLHDYRRALLDES